MNDAREWNAYIIAYRLFVPLRQFTRIMGKYPGAKLKMEHGNAGEFGKYYTGSAKAKQNHRKAKMMAKRSH